ncbi:MAG TPA: bifunctional DNA-formamidopyrimidine glycosylase/DNA-(apurinic or apyrimidinic site) lyase [Dehalococcoidia bacterium]|nr:bifunctional DNA-formamidopyrimidine glycosylase/DNA-(apurinic or apyrimidinic site) lyase [Dehalococcoidia bacterium]
MPELPEVETIRRDLLPLVRDHTIAEAWVSPNAPRLVQLMPPNEFCRLLAGRRIEDIGRRGKYLTLQLDGGLMWVVHLRMTGRLQHRTEGCPEHAHLRATFRLDDGTSLCYADQRKFGMMWLVDDWTLVHPGLGPEPLEDTFDHAAFHTVLKRRGAPIKSVLLDQTVIAGIGNIYADEALLAARISPKKPAKNLTRPAVDRLHAAIRDVLHEALGDRGSSFRDYVDAAGREGGHQLRVKVFRRTGEPCYVCGTEIRRIKLGGRSTHYCPACQK